MGDVIILAVVTGVGAVGLAAFNAWRQRERIRLAREQLELDRERDQHVSDVIADRLSDCRPPGRTINDGGD